MKVFCLAALCVTMCWPVADPDVSGGLGNCEGHEINYDCGEDDSGAACNGISQSYAAGADPQTGEKWRKPAGDDTRRYCADVAGNNSHCSGSARLGDSGCNAIFETTVFPL